MVQSTAAIQRVVFALLPWPDPHCDHLIKLVVHLFGPICLLFASAPTWASTVAALHAPPAERFTVGLSPVGCSGKSRNLQCEDRDTSSQGGGGKDCTEQDDYIATLALSTSREYDNRT
jgi:hypothetical protein